uniref:Uncharacterized protein n=1 Tax=Cacopsylla melanoneura TaxID=428564 RepID=A0A8D8TKA5_9HEMI
MVFLSVTRRYFKEVFVLEGKERTSEVKVCSNKKRHDLMPLTQTENKRFVFFWGSTFVFQMEWYTFCYKFLKVLTFLVQSPGTIFLCNKNLCFLHLKKPPIENKVNIYFSKFLL